MHRHAEADVDVHSDEELAALLGANVARRSQLRAWPLSSVELLEMGDGRRLVYKAQRLLTVEPAFYRTVAGSATATPALPSRRVLTESQEASTLVLEHLDRPRALDSAAESDVVRTARRVVETIASLPDGLPCYVDIGTPARWAGEVGDTLSGLSALVADGRFTGTTPDDVRFVDDWAASGPVVATVEETSRLTNGDMKFDHVFLGPEGYRLVDWAVPAIAPPEIDLVMLLEDRAIPPLKYVAAPVVGIRWFLHLRWAVVAKLHLIPEMPTLCDHWATQGIAAIRHAHRE